MNPQVCAPPQLTPTCVHTLAHTLGYAPVHLYAHDSPCLPRIT